MDNLTQSFRSSVVTVGLSLLAFSLISLLVSCTDKKKNDKPTDDSLVGVYHTDRVDSPTSDEYEPETLYIVNDDGTIQIEYMYESQGAAGKAINYKEVSKGKYSIDGATVKVFDFVSISACAGESRMPSTAAFQFKKEDSGVRMFASDEDTQFLKTADQVTIDKFNATKLCDNNNVVQPPKTAGNPSPKEGPAPKGVGNSSGGEKRGSGGTISVVGLPPEIKPVTVNPGWPSNNPRGEPYIEFKNESWVDKVVNAAKVNCELSSECPEFVGLLIGKRAEAGTITMYQCSTTYLGDGYFSTNSHCYPDQIVGNSFRTTCENKLWVKMPKTAERAEETFNCDNIVYLTRPPAQDDPTAGEPADVMIFKVKEPVQRVAAKVDWNNGIGQREILKAWTVDPVHSEPGINGKIVAKSCTTNDPKNILPQLAQDPQFQNLTYQNVSIADCSKKMMKGNSGSTLFTTGGIGVGVFSHIYVANKGETQSDGGFGTKYLCSFPSGEKSSIFAQSKPAKECVALPDRAFTTLSHNRIVRVIKAIESKINELYRAVKSGSYFQGREQTLDQAKLIYADPNSKFSFPRWKWFSTVGNFGKSNPIIYRPEGKYESEKIGRTRDAAGNFLLNYYELAEEKQGRLSPEPGVSDSDVTVLNSFSRYGFVLPECIDYDLEQMPRVRNDSWWNPFGSRSYTYQEVSVSIPLKRYFEIDYSIESDVIRFSGDVDGIHLNEGSSRLLDLPFEIVLKFTPSERGGALGSVDFIRGASGEKDPLKNAVRFGFYDISNDQSGAVVLERCR